MTMLVSWDVYEISSETTELHGVMCRGRIRKFCIDNGINVLVENAADKDNAVRFAVIEGSDVSLIEQYVKSIFKDVEVKVILKSLMNPVLSVLKINITERYS